MKKKLTRIIMAAVLCISLLGLTGCGNKQFLDTTYTFKTAIIELPGNEVITVEIKSWGDYEGDQLQIEATDGTTYLVHASKCVLKTK